MTGYDSGDEVTAALLARIRSQVEQFVQYGSGGGAQNAYRQQQQQIQVKTMCLPACLAV